MLQQQENIRPDQRTVQPLIGENVSPHNVVRIIDTPEEEKTVQPDEGAADCGDAGSKEPSDNEIDLNEEVTNEHLQLWLRRCRRKYIQGVTVIKVANTGKLVRRQLYINAKPEYLELISSRLFDTAYHIGSVDSIKCSRKSPEFDAFGEQQPGCLPKLEKSLVLMVGGRSLSLVFKSVSDRLDAQLYLKAWSRMIKDYGADKLRDFERRCTVPGMIAHRREGWGEEGETNIITEGDTTVVVRANAGANSGANAADRG